MLYPISMVIYTLVGAAIFYAIENPLERETIQLSNAKFEDILSK